MSVEPNTNQKHKQEASRRGPTPAAIGLAAVVAIGITLLYLARQLSGRLTLGDWPSSSPRDLVSTVVVGPVWLTLVIFVVLLALVGLVAFWVARHALNWRRRRRFRLFRLGFASGDEIREMLAARAVIKKAGAVRPSYKGRRNINPNEIGFYLGRDRRSRQKLYSSVEDVMVILAPPRQGKDVHFCAPYTIDAPGACIVTSTRSDAFTNTYAARAKLGKVWVFDPNDMVNWPERFRWSPVRGAEYPRAASDRAGAFVHGAGFEMGGQGAFFVSASIMVVRSYLHAAAVGGMTMRDVVRWATQPTNPEPVRLLRDAERANAAAEGWGAALEGAMNAHPEHRGAVWATVVQTLSCFTDPGVLAACSPEPDEVFNMAEFLSGRNTLYILGKEKKNGSVTPIVTAMLEDMFDEIRKLAARMPGSRLDPPLTVELNEAAHIAPLPSLPGYMGDSGGFSMALHVYLQSLSQARSRWGEHEAMIMWDNAAVRVIMGGAGNVDDLEDVSRLMGDVTSPTNSPSRDEGRRVLSPEEVRTLKFGTAVVVARAARPVEVELTPWWKRKDGAEIAAGKAETERRVLQYTEEAERNDRYGAYARAKASPRKLDPYDLTFDFKA